MLGIVLAGGFGTRLRPLTNTRNKHTLPIADRAMVDYPLMLLVSEGITDIGICLNGPYGRQVEEVVGDGSRLGCKIAYFYKLNVGGPARSLNLARDWALEQRADIAVLFGDGIFFSPLQLASRRGPHMYLMNLPQGGADGPEKYAQARTDGERVIELVEKPTRLVSTLVQAGAFVFPVDVFKVISHLERHIPQEREIGITDVNNEYVRDGRLTHSLIEPGHYIDCGTPEAFEEAEARIRAGECFLCH